MKSNDNQSKRIYDKTTRTWYEVPEEDYRQYDRWRTALRKRMQYRGECFCPRSKWWLCDGNCLDCEFHNNTTISLDDPLPDGEGTLADYVPDDAPLIEDVLADEMVLTQLEDIIEAVNGKPLLVAYWFRHDLERIRRRFDVREIKTSADIADWNAGNIPVAVIHPASAGHGLNLQAGGSTLVWFGLTWSLELYQQTNARLWRQGQESRTVVIQHIIAADTIDGQILAALKRKDKTQAALINAVKAVM